MDVDMKEEGTAEAAATAAAVVAVAEKNTQSSRCAIVDTFLMDQ